MYFFHNRLPPIESHFAKQHRPQEYTMNFSLSNNKKNNHDDSDFAVEK